MWEFSAPKEDRLDRLLRQHQPSAWLSRQAWEKLVEDKAVSVDGRWAKKPGEKIPAGARIQVNLPPLGLHTAPVAAKAVWTSPAGDWAVFDKAAGIPTYPLLPWENGTLANQIARYVMEKGGSGSATEEFAALAEPPLLEGGLVQRLDNDTSGLVACAFRAETKARLRELFAGQVIKKYLAVTGPEGERLGGLHRVYFSAGEGAKVLARREGKAGDREASLTVRVAASSADGALLEVKTSQGLRHVVRAGMAALGAPLAGDQVYGGPALAEYHQLHAWSLRVPGVAQEIQVAPPSTFLSLLQKIGLHWSA